MKVVKILAVSILFLGLLSPITAAAKQQQQQEITIYIQAALGINITVDCGGSDPKVLKTYVGEPENCLLTVKNTGNIDDIIRLEAPIDSPSPDRDRGWIDYHLECPGTIGKCSLEFSYESYLPSGRWPEVRNIRLTPQTDTTQIYLEATPYKIGTTEISITGYSLTNRTKQGNIAHITVRASTPKTQQWGPFVADGLSNLSVVILILLSAVPFSVAKFR